MDLTPSVRVVRKGDSDKAQKSRGLELLRSHYRNVFVKDRLTTVCLERSFTLRLSGKIPYTGIVDRIATDSSDTLHVIDFKTTRRPPASLDDESALQIRSYGLETILRYKVPRVRLVYQFLETSEELTEELTRHGANQVVRELVSRVETVERAESFPANLSPLCPWCGYQRLCKVGNYSEGDDCPRCGGTLERRRGSRGPFLGCDNYPDCRFSCDVKEDDIHK